MQAQDHDSIFADLFQLIREDRSLFNGNEGVNNEIMSVQKDTILSPASAIRFSIDKICKNSHEEDILSQSFRVPKYRLSKKAIESVPLNTMKVKKLIDSKTVRIEGLRQRTEGLQIEPRDAFVNSPFSLSNTDENYIEIEDELIDDREIVITIVVVQKSTSRAQQEISLLGCQTLADLANSIYCVQSALLYKDNMDEKHDYMSNCGILIDKTFYGSKSFSPWIDDLNRHLHMSMSACSEELKQDEKTINSIANFDMTSLLEVAAAKSFRMKQSVKSSMKATNTISSSLKVKQKPVLRDWISNSQSIEKCSSSIKSGTQNSNIEAVRDSIESMIRKANRIAGQSAAVFPSNIEIVHDLNVPLKEIQFQIGVQYLMVHLGACEHIFFVSDIRRPFRRLMRVFNLVEESCNIIHPNFPRDQYFPRRKALMTYKRRRCDICDIFTAKHVVYGDHLGPWNPCSYCQECLEMMHYDESGHLLHDNIHVFPYAHDE